MSIESHKQILPDYKNLITSLQITNSISPILFQVMKFLKSLSQTSMLYEQFEYCCS